MKKIPQEQYPELMGLINETYRDEVEIIVDAAIQDNGDIIAVALDGAKQLAIKITDTDIAIKIINSSEFDPDGAQIADLSWELAQMAEKLMNRTS